MRIVEDNRNKRNIKWGEHDSEINSPLVCVVHPREWLMSLHASEEEWTIVAVKTCLSSSSTSSSFPHIYCAVCAYIQGRQPVRAWHTPSVAKT